MSIILITGASSGIGKATAEKLLRQKHTVYVAARRVEAMQDLQRQGAMPLRLDVTNDAEVSEVAEQLIAKHGGVEVLINNAGFGMYGSVEETTIDDARYQVRGQPVRHGPPDTITGSGHARQGFGQDHQHLIDGGKIYSPLGAWYHATKHAVEGWSDCLRIELAPFGIKVVIIEPGAISTEFNDVVNDPMLKRSGRGAYGKLAHATAKSIASVRGSSPTVVADVWRKLLRRPARERATLQAASPAP